MKNIYLLIVLFVFCIFSNGCATILKGDKSDVFLNSDPPSNIYIDGVNYGNTPKTISLRSDRNHYVTFKRVGYKNGIAIINSYVSAGYIFADLIFSITFIPLIIDWGTENWKVLDETAFATLEPELNYSYPLPPPPF